MKITEPMTMITDYLITIYTVFLGILIMYYSNDQGALFLAILLFLTGLGAFLGGTSHGFKQNFSESTNNQNWKATTISIGSASLFFILGVAVSSSLNNIVVITLTIFALVQFSVYFFWMLRHDEFIFVIINYSIAMLIVLAIKSYSWIIHDDPTSIWIIMSIIISVIASAIQAKGIGIHSIYFNHNDLFHIVQLPGFYCLYRAAILL